MKIPLPVLSKLKLDDAATEVVTGQLDRFPPLVLDRCLADCGSDLVKSIVASSQAGSKFEVETLTMPRRGFGPRPVTIATPAIRALYRALVQKLEGDLASNRTNEHWQSHDGFGKPSTPTDPWTEYYLVEFDIASFYEYIEHELLRNELIARTMDVTHVNHIIELLGETFGTSRGLPQLTPASDVLADTYIDVMSRELIRAYEDVSRFADDFKIKVNDWGTATAVIEDAAESARRLGLILSSEKTSIWKASTLQRRMEEESAFLERYFAEARDELTAMTFLMEGIYGDITVEVPPGNVEMVQEAFRRILTDWLAAKGENVPLHTQQIRNAIVLLENAEARLSDELISEIVFRVPLRLERIARYLLARAEEQSANWVTLDKLAQMPRQSPWVKIWLLHVADNLAQFDSAEYAAFFRWATGQLSDRHEVVRSEAAWALARHGAMPESELPRLYRDASSITRPAIAACCGAAGVARTSGLGKAIYGDRALSACGFAWGESHGRIGDETHQ